MSIAGWSGGKLSARKLYHSVSTSGPDRDGEPEPRKISTISSTTTVTGCCAPRQRAPRRHREVEPAPSRARRSASSAASRAAKARVERFLQPVDGGAVPPRSSSGKRGERLEQLGESAALPAERARSCAPPRAHPQVEARAIELAAQSRSSERAASSSSFSVSVRDQVRVTTSYGTTVAAYASKCAAARPSGTAPPGGDGDSDAALLRRASRLVGELAKGLRIADREVGQDLPVHLDAGLPEAGHRARL